MHRILSRSSRTLRLSALVLAALLALAACADDDGEDSADADEPSGEEEAESAPPEDGDDEDDSEPVDDGDPPDGDGEEEDAEEGDQEALEDLETLLAETSDAPFAVTYEGEDEVEGAFEMTMAHDPPASMFGFTQGGEEARMFQPGDDSFVMCTLEQGNWQCMRLPGADDAEEMGMGMAMPFVFDVDAIVRTAPAWGSVTSETILGRSARCAVVDVAQGPEGQQQAEGRTEVCVDEETGAGLRFHSESDEVGEYSLEATAFEEPDPSLFEFPAEPQDLGDAFD